MNLPSIRMARITKLEKYNKTNSAADVVWSWREVVIEQIQYLNSDNEWVALPVVDIYDDSAKKNEEQATIEYAKQIKVKDKELLTLLDSIDNLETYWQKIDMASKLCYLLDYEKARFDFNRHEDGFMYYSNAKGLIARTKNNDSFVRGDILKSFITPIER